MKMRMIEQRVFYPDNDVLVVLENEDGNDDDEQQIINRLYSQYSSMARLKLTIACSSSKASKFVMIGKYGITLYVTAPPK